MSKNNYLKEERSVTACHLIDKCTRYRSACEIPDPYLRKKVCQSLEALCQIKGGEGCTIRNNYVEVFNKPRTEVRGTLRASKSSNKLRTLVRSETQELFDLERKEK